MARTPTFGSRFDNSPLWHIPGPELRKSSITSELCKSLALTATAPPAVDDAAHAQQVLRHILRGRILDVAERTAPPVEEQMIFVPVRFLRKIDQPASLRFKPLLKPDDIPLFHRPQKSWNSIAIWPMLGRNVCVFHANRAAVPRQSEQTFHAKPSGDSTAKRALRTWRRGVSSFTPSRLRLSNHFGACASIRLIA
ncbi:hypothetical protein QF000_000699 [Paraburkholderia atlantica]